MAFETNPTRQLTSPGKEKECGLGLLTVAASPGEVIIYVATDHWNVTTTYLLQATTVTQGQQTIGIQTLTTQ